MQTDVVKKAGINPKTLLSNILYWQKLERGISTALILPYLGLMVFGVLVQRTDSSGKPPSWVSLLFVLSLVSIVLGVLYNLWAMYVVPKLYAWRVRVFADKNNLHLLPKNQLVGLIPASVIRSDTHNIQAVGSTLPVLDQRVTVFDYSCIVGSGKHQTSLTKGLAVLQLKGDYPHLFLDSKKNGKNHQYAASQKVELEGNFSKYFDMYMPEGSQAGSLTVFAPDMMQTILDSGKLFDVEINGNQAVIISDELVFTKRVLPNILNCAAGLMKEFKELDRTWQPEFSPSKQGFVLKGQPLWRVILIALVPIFIGLSSNLIPLKYRHPIKLQSTPIVYPQDNSPVSRDAATLAAAHQIADKLNTYTAKYPVPSSLAKAHIANSLYSISYTKLSPDIYQFCATYHQYINGNGPTGASGNIEAYYGATVDSPNLPSTLQIVEWHNQGKNCQIIKPVLPSSS